DHILAKLSLEGGPSKVPLIYPSLELKIPDKVMYALLYEYKVAAFLLSILYFPCKLAAFSASAAPEGSLAISSNKGLDKADEVVYKRVAVVENFYAIIYDVHVEMDGRSGKHAGQKRTYRAVAEMYAFLPREAVTRFLMSCSDCQKRMHLQGLTTNGTSAANSINASTKKSNSSVGRRANNHSSELKNKANPNTGQNQVEMDYSLPITTTYLKRMKSLGFNGYQNEPFPVNGEIVEMGGELSISEEQADNEEAGIVSETASDQSCDDGHDTESEEELPAINQQRLKQRFLHQSANNDCINDRLILDDEMPFEVLEQEDEELYDEGMDSNDVSIPLDMSKVKKEDPTLASDEPINMTAKQQQMLGVSVLKRKLLSDAKSYRMVPISRQPKEKIQAIIDSCRRQFPEFAERSRKRIRTYLKSCRRTRRHKTIVTSITSGKDPANGGECRNIHATISTSSYHLTSPMAEQILANACENEVQNAKRMRLGLKPVSTAYPNASTPSNFNSTANYETAFSMSATTNYNQTHPRYSLNPSEMAAVKQLIAGYRESAAFLLRSADELEHLLLQQT
ncbi:nucleolar protein 4-like protein, partial [Dinothrombium tinctorium]